MFYRAQLGVMAGALSLLCYACSQQVTRPTVPTTRVAATCSDGSDLSTRVFLLQPGFSPVDFGSCRNAQECANKGFQGPRSNGHPSATYLNPILDAYNLAPQFFKNMLCSLNAIYVDPPDISDPNKSQAWGMRERATSGMPTHIGVSQNIFDELSNADYPYMFYEDSVVEWLLTPLSPWLNLKQAAGTNPNPWIANVSYAAYPDPASNDPIAIAVLGILAHEMGHVLWWEYDVGTKSESGKFFSDFSWTNKNFPVGYHVFGREDQGNPRRNPPGVREVRYNAQYSDTTHFNEATKKMEKIYGYNDANGSEWASLFATLSLDEDFIETLKLLVLTGGCANLNPLSQLQINIPNFTGSPPIPGSSTPIDIIHNNLCNTNSKLYAKANWVAAFVAPFLKNPSQMRVAPAHY